MTELLGTSGQEYDTRLAAVRAFMLERRLDAVLLSAPENIFYLTGLDHWGYFAPHMLIVPLQGEVVLVTRAMERVTIANQVRNARFEGQDRKSVVEGKSVAVSGKLGGRRRRKKKKN